MCTRAGVRQMINDYMVKKASHLFRENISSHSEDQKKKKNH